jgi:hypothetical protein
VPRTRRAGAPIVADAVESYLGLVDAEVGGLVEGLYLEGSVALGDFRPHASDIDFVATTRVPPDAAALAGLERVHVRLRGLRPRPFFEGIHVTWDDLARDPALATAGPSTHEGLFRAVGGGDRNPVTWHTLARHGVACRGPAVADLDVWADLDVLAAWQDANLDEYWGRLLDCGAQLASTAGLFGLTRYAAAWTVTGVCRLHYTLAAGDVTSKDGAGRYALEVFPDRWHRVIGEARRIRRAEPGGSLYPTPLTRRRDVLAFGRMVVADGHRLYAERP